DEDEEAMLKVLGCLPCDRVKNVVNSIGVEDLMDEFEGTEWDKLVIRLQACGLIGFCDWDDDASRRFISQTSKAKLSPLSIESIVCLCRNLFSGDCGDDDEAAIIKLIDSQHPCKVKNILRNHITYSDFDDNVDGDEWTELSSILDSASHACGHGHSVSAISR